MVEVINVTSMDAVSNNDVKLVETRTEHFA